MNFLYTLFGRPVDVADMPALIERYGLPAHDYLPGGIVTYRAPLAAARPSTACQGCGASLSTSICDYCRRTN